MAEIDIEKLAREADPGFGDANGVMHESLVGAPAIKRFAALVLEEAAKVCEQMSNGFHSPHEYSGCCEDALRTIAEGLKP